MAIRLTVVQKKWLLSAHLLFVATWLGSAVCWLLLLYTTATTSNEATLKAAFELMPIVDSVIASSSPLVAITGILLCLLTSWGMLRFRWIVVKEVAALLIILSGATVLASLGIANAAFVSAQGLSARQDPVFLGNQVALLAGAAILVVILVAMVPIAVFKPWGQRGHSLHEASTTSVNPPTKQRTEGAVVGSCAENGGGSISKGVA